MSDTFAAPEHRVAEARKTLPYVEEATGIAIALGEKVVAVELFDKPQTCRKVRDRILSGYMLDAIENLAHKHRADAEIVEQLLRATKDAKWDQVGPVGEGEAYRAETAYDRASALCLNAHLVHGSSVVQ